MLDLTVSLLGNFANLISMLAPEMFYLDSNFSLRLTRLLQLALQLLSSVPCFTQQLLALL